MRINAQAEEHLLPIFPFGINGSVQAAYVYHPIEELSAQVKNECWDRGDVTGSLASSYLVIFLVLGLELEAPLPQTNR